MPISPELIESIKILLMLYKGNPMYKRKSYLAAVRYVYRTVSRQGGRATPLIYNYSGLKQAVETVKYVQAL